MFGHPTWWVSDDRRSLSGSWASTPHPTCTHTSMSVAEGNYRAETSIASLARALALALQISKSPVGRSWFSIISCWNAITIPIIEFNNRFSDYRLTSLLGTADQEVPACFKSLQVLPLLKNTDLNRSLPVNYRPISNLLTGAQETCAGTSASSPHQFYVLQQFLLLLLLLTSTVAMTLCGVYNTKNCKAPMKHSDFC